MKRTQAHSIIAILTLVTAALLAACGGQPAIAVTPDKFDFGIIPATAPVTGTVQLHNDGQGTLHIASLHTSCGCTTATTTTDSLAPGKTADLAITFDPQAHKGLYGKLLRIVYVESDDPEHPELEIPVTVNVLSPEEANR